MKIYDTLIIGAGPAGLTCALILGSANEKPFAKDKIVGVITNQERSALQNAELNHVLGFAEKTNGGDVLKDGLVQLKNTYPTIEQVTNEMVVEVKKTNEETIEVITDSNTYIAKTIVVALGASNMFSIKGLMDYVVPHKNIPAFKGRIMLKNSDHVVEPGIYVAGILAGWRSQFAIAAGSGAQVATDILSEWNDGNHTMIHDIIV